PVSADIAEVDVKDLFPRSEIADYVPDLLVGVSQHLGHGTLAEIQSVIRALLYADELLEPLHGTQHGVDALVSGRRHAWIVRMARHPYLVFVGDRNHFVQEI